MRAESGKASTANWFSASAVDGLGQRVERRQGGRKRHSESRGHAFEHFFDILRISTLVEDCTRIFVLIACEFAERA